MRILITGICGFVGSTLALAIREAGLNWEICGLDNLIRSGSEENRTSLKKLGIRIHHGDIRCASDFESLPACDWILDAAANPSVLAGIDGLTSSRQLVEHNLLGTVNLLECCKRWRAGFILLSTSRVYSIPPLAALPVEVRDGAFRPLFPKVIETQGSHPPVLTSAATISHQGISESFSTAAPLSLYGSTKLCSESLALEYGETFDFPVWINRCGVLAGGGQFGRPDQGIFAFWIHSHRRRRPLKYIGFDGLGHQVRDCLHPRDLISLLQKQVEHPQRTPDTGQAQFPRIINLAGGISSARSLNQLTAWCDNQFGPHPVASQAEPRPFDLPWVVLDHSLATQTWGWCPQTPVESILQEIATQATDRPDWLGLSQS